MGWFLADWLVHQVKAEINFLILNHQFNLECIFTKKTSGIVKEVTHDLNHDLLYFIKNYPVKQKNLTSSDRETIVGFQNFMH